MGTASGADVAIAYNQTTKTALISWRGTVSTRDWLEVECSQTPHTMRIGSTSTRRTREVHAQVLKNLMVPHADCPLQQVAPACICLSPFQGASLGLMPQQPVAACHSREPTVATAMIPVLSCQHQIHATVDACSANSLCAWSQLLTTQL